MGRETLNGTNCAENTEKVTCVYLLICMLYDIILIFLPSLFQLAEDDVINIEIMY